MTQDTGGRDENPLEKHSTLQMLNSAAQKHLPRNIL